MSSPAADVSVRIAREGDAPAIAATTLAAWRATYADLLPGEVLAALEPDAAAATWRAAIADPGPNRLLVACAGGEVVGYAAFGPGAGPGAELGELEVAPAHRRRGHGSRLLAAVVDHLHAQGVTSMLTWAAEADTARAAFLESAGFAPDAVGRVLDLDGTGAVTVRQRRWSALLA